MAMPNIQNSSIVKQTKSSKDGRLTMLRDAFHTFLDSLIRNNAKHKSDCYSLFANSLSYDDQKLFLSYLVVPDDYEYYTATPTRTREVLKDYHDDMQFLINDRIDDLYREDMEEMGMRLCRHSDNNEIYYIR